MSASVGALPPWKLSLLRWMSTKTPLRELYRRMGWGKGKLANLRRVPDLRISEASRLADALGAPRAEFLATLAEHTAGKAKPMEPKLAMSRPRPVSEVKLREPGKRPKRRKK